MSFAALSFLGFSLRGFWMLQESPRLQLKLVKIFPHIVDTLLLLSAIVLVVMSQQYPFSTDWVTMKLVLLVLYVVFGTFALKRGKTKAIRTVFLGVSLLTILSIFAVAGIKPSF